MKEFTLFADLLN